MVEAPPAQAPGLKDPVGLDALSDDLFLCAFVRAPFVCHGTLHAVNKRFKTLLRSDDFLKQRLEFGLAEHGVVIAGGMRDVRAVADCHIELNGRCMPISPMSGPRAVACSVIIDNEMWVMGGVDDDANVLATVEVYSPKTNSWRSCTPMSQRRAAAVAGVVGGRLVVAGGCCDGDLLTSVEAYTGTGWTPVPPMPHAAWHATACALNGRLYVMGGYFSNKLQVLEMTAESGLAWTVKAELPADRIHGAASAVHQGKIWVMGGCVGENGDPAQSSSSVITYNADADTWATGPPLPSPFYGRATTIDGGIFFYGTDYGCLPASVLTYDTEARHGPRWEPATAGAAEFGHLSVLGAVLLG